MGQHQQKLRAAGLEVVALSVQHNGVTDHIIHRTEPGRDGLVVGDLRLQGATAFVRERDGIPEMMALWGGSELRWKDYVLSGSGTYEGEVVGALRSEVGDDRDALVVAGDLPEGDGLKGATGVVRFGDGSTLGYRVAGVRRVEGKIHLLLKDDPGIAVEGGGMRHLFFPLREIPGRVTYRIRTSAFVRLGDGKAEVEAVGEARFWRAEQGEEKPSGGKL